MANTYSKVTGWARPDEILKSQKKSGAPSLWGENGVQPGGVRQGSLGDCWFLAAAAALAEHPDRIQRVFTNKEYSAEGVFEVTVYLKGSPIKEVVDDRLPVRAGTNPRYTNYGVQSPINSKMGENGGWWLPILEKAYAKFNVNYANLHGGDPEQALRELSGMPAKKYRTSEYSDKAELFKLINDADKAGYAMTAACMK